MKWPKDNFIKNIILLSGGSLLAQGINFIAAPLMTRFFTADDIGMFTYITTISYIFTPIICLRYETAIILESDKENVYSLIKICAYVSVILSVFVCVCYGLYFLFANENTLQSYLPILVLLLLISGITNIFNAYNTWRQQYSILTKVSVYRALANLLTIVAFGFGKLSVWGLLAGHTITQLVGLWQQGSNIFLHRKKILGRESADLMSMVKKYRGLPLYSVPAIFFNNASYLSVNFFIADLYGMECLAFYSLSFRLLGVPLSMISNNVGSVFYEKAGKEYAVKGSFATIFVKTFWMLLGISIPIFGIICFIAPDFCTVYFGGDWQVAGEYVRIMCILFAVRFVFAPLTAGILILRKNKAEMFCQMGFCIVSVLVYLMAASMAWNVEAYLYVLAVGFAIIYCLFGAVIYKLS